MVKQTKKDEQNRGLAIIIAGVGIIALLVFIFPQLRSAYYFYTHNGATMRDPGQGPSEEEQKETDKYFASCPLDKLLFETETDTFDLTSVKCSKNDLYKEVVKDGEEGKVEIYTQDFEAGKQLFRDWLADHGLKESPTLRIIYTHKPR